MNKRIILVSKGGGGKDFFKNYLKKKGYETDVSYTTRERRKGEVDGETYHYLTESLFNSFKSNSFFNESVTFNGWQYGTSNKNWLERKVCIKTPSGIKNLKSKDIEESIIIYFDIDRNVRFERLEKRKDADNVGRRLAADTIDFKGFETFHIRVTDEKFNCKKLLKTIKQYDKI
jgi:guanylate kinase